MVVRSKDLRTRVFRFKSVLLLPIPQFSLLLNGIIMGPNRFIVGIK